MMAVLLCFGIVPSNAFAAEYEYDGYISMIDYNGRGYSLSSSLPGCHLADTAQISLLNCELTI